MYEFGGGTGGPFNLRGGLEEFNKILHTLDTKFYKAYISRKKYRVKTVLLFRTVSTGFISSDST